MRSPYLVAGLWLAANREAREAERRCREAKTKWGRVASAMALLRHTVRRDTLEEVMEGATRPIGT